MNPITASERKGILWVAIVALAVTAIGAGLSYFSKPEVAPEEFAEVELLVSGDTVNNEKPVSSAKKRGTSKSSKKNGTKKQKKVYPQRSPLDEEVNL